MVTILQRIGINTLGTPVTDIGQTGEHEVTLRAVTTIGGVGVTAITHLGVIFPNTLQHVVILESHIRVTRDTIIIVVIHESSHTETFVINNAITKVHTIDSHLVKLIAAEQVFITVTDFTGAIRIEFGVITTIGIHIRSLEEVNTDGRRLVTVSPALTGTIDIGTIVAVTQTTGNITTYIVIVSITQIGVNPLREVCVR